MDKDKSRAAYILLIILNTIALFWAWHVKKEEKRIHQATPQVRQSDDWKNSPSSFPTPNIHTNED